MTVLNWVEKLDIVFCLNSSIESPSDPPSAACGLVTVNEAKTSLAVTGFNPVTKNLGVLLNVTKLLAGALAVAPPPVKYLTVKVVFDGAIQSVLVNIKLVGLKAVLSFDSPKGKPKPTLSGLGTIVASFTPVVPAPNWICKEPLSKNLVTNLR